MGPIRIFFKRICHWGPLIALGITKVVTIVTVKCLTQLYPPWVTIGGTVCFVSFMSSSILTIFYLMDSMLGGPGTVPKGWKPKKLADKEFLQYCTVCEGYKAPRAHHCRKCGTCNMKMDHHCPWINNCVGHMNHASFVKFMFFAVVGCSQSVIAVGMAGYKSIVNPWYYYQGENGLAIARVSIWSMLSYMLVFGLAVGVVIAVGALFILQIRAILRNRTSIEDWILEKALHRRSLDKSLSFVYPYDLGRWNNFKYVFYNDETQNDGLEWPVKEGCNQYTLTVEQLEQKRMKRKRSRLYLMREHYSGSWFPVTKGLCTCCHPPCSDESRIPLRKNDYVVVTRWKKYWLYGEIVNNSCSTKDRQRGWFPSGCCVEIVNYDTVPENLIAILQRRKRTKHD